MNVAALRAFYAEQIEAGQEGRRPAVAAPQGDHDEDLRSHHVRPLRLGLLQGGPRQARRDPRGDRRQRQQRSRRCPRQARPAARRQEGGDRGGHRSRLRDPARPRHGRLAEGHHQPARAQQRHRRRLDAQRRSRRRQDVEQGRRASGLHRHGAGSLLRDHVRGDPRRRQEERPVRPGDHGQRRQRRPDGPEGRGVRLPRQDLRGAGGRHDSASSMPRAPPSSSRRSRPATSSGCARSKTRPSRTG